ncbi:hypothetical protein KEC55_00090 [Burkholderia cepacia]|nr:hypothetical protein [Burkholderia cepacia]WGY68438.1 hypothetical protein KEC55_00090 [Burkholderia cepacia]
MRVMLAYRLGTRIQVAALRLDDETGFRKLWEAGELICRRCRQETLKEAA